MGSSGKGIRCKNLEKRSMITRMIVKQCDSGNLVIKSMCVPGHAGIVKGTNLPAGRVRGIMLSRTERSEISLNACWASNT